MKKIFTVFIVVLMGIIALGVSINAHKADVYAAKEAIFAANTRQFAEWSMDEAPRMRARALAYIYKGEENAPEIADAKAHLAESHAAWEAYYNGKSSYEEANDTSCRAIWKAGKALAAWADRTGRSPVDFGEGIIYCYFAYEEDGVTERSESLCFERSEEITMHECRVYDLFKI